MSKRDYYEVLGVSRGADEADIKKSYRRAAQKYHPDRNADKAAEDKFKEAKEAYEVLTDPRKRAAYDQFGHAGVQSSAGGGGYGAGANFGDIFGEVFGDIFGGGRGGRGRAARGADLRYNLDISLEDAVQGATVQIRVPAVIHCRTCAGSGAKPGTKPTPCVTCAGMGQVRMQQGFFSIQQTCPRCHGSGSLITEACLDCGGQGRVQEHKTLSVKIPAGVDTGDRIRLSGEGEAGEVGGQVGDLYVQIRVKPHAIFTREENNLCCEVPISFITAALGGELEVPTLDGHADIKIPSETQTGKVFRVRGKGVKPLRSGTHGDLLCRIRVETPVKLTGRQKELLREFEHTLQEGGERHNPQTHDWLKGVKRFFEDMKF